MTQGQQPAALRLADEYEYEGFIGKHQFAREEWCRKAALELRSLYAGNAALRSGYDASRHEIGALRNRVQELGQMARDCNSRRVIELQAKVRELEDMLAAVGAGGVEPLRKADHFRDATQMVPQGWKLVPVDPTLAMVRAGRDTPLAGEADDDSPEDYRCVYRAMLAAAPEPPTDHLRDAAKMVPVGWAISYDGKNPHALWTAGEGDLLDLEVKRQGGTACKMELFARVEK